MGPIRSLFSPPDPKKTESNHKAEKSAGASPNKNASGSKVGGSKDQVNISDAGRELLSLKSEAAKYLKDVKDSEVLTVEEVDSIKEKIASKYYFDTEVINTIVDKMINLPNFFNR